MSLPADSAAVAVLVLAWDETTPAVRALVAATDAAAPAVDSVVVLVPAGPASDELTPEEFLPLTASLLPQAPASPAATAEPLPTSAPADATATTQAAAEAALAKRPTAWPSTSAHAPARASSAWRAPAAAVALPLPASSASGQADPVAVAATLPSPAVRILRLSEYSLATLAAHTRQALPAPAWLGTARPPTAPYLGSSAAEAPVPLSTPVLGAVSEPVLVGLEAVPAESAAPSPGPAAVGPSYPSSYPSAELPAAADAESDTQPVLASEQPTPTATTSTTELSEDVADELGETLTVDVTPVQAGWPEALASLQAPAAVDTTSPANEPAAASQVLNTSIQPVSSDSAVAARFPSAPAALRPAPNQFDAPNLNFQIIQYARFAVPLALATQPFAVIYAPAWPTWLAAQELRQRTGRPLVLHLSALAAADEPLDLAAGWPAEIQRQALHRADLILTETLALALRLRRELALPAHRVRPIPAADADAIAQALGAVQAL